MLKTQLYCSVDIEADGPIPGESSMLSIGAAMYTAKKELLDTFEVNLRLLPGARPHPDTTKFWSEFPEAYTRTRVDPINPADAMTKFVAWCAPYPGAIFVGYPAVFDWMFMQWYLIKFVGQSPFGFGNAVDIRSYAAALLNKPADEVYNATMPTEWFDPLPHTHVAVEDAIEQGAMFCNMLAWKK